MSKIKDFLNATGEIKNSDRLIAVTGVLVLSTMAQVLNYKLFCARLDNIVQEEKVSNLKETIAQLKIENEDLRERQR